MTPEQFCYWLQSKAELDPNPPTPEQWDSIREHLSLVFTKETKPVFPVSPGPTEPLPPQLPLPIIC